MSALDVEDVAKRFGATDILAGISLSVAAGEFLVLLGPSGCGKSTLLNIIAGLEAADRGRILIGGVDMTRAEPRRRDIAMVFQSYALYPTMSARANMGFGLKMRGARRREIDERVADAARLLDIEALLDRKPAELSGGQRQRVAIGRAIVRRPQIFMFDEPLSNLDATLRGAMRLELKELHRRLAATIVYVTHDQVEAMTLATRIAVMNHGRIEQIGTPREIYDRPATSFVAGFTGAPPMSLVPGRLDRADGRPVFRPEGTDIALALPGAPDAASAGLLLGLRPEHVGAPDVTTGSHRQVVELEPLIVEPTGADSHIVFRLGTATLVGRFTADTTVATPMRVALALDRALLFDAATGLRL
jgi:multiple sugar transport system ATP-binding protein